MQKQLTLHVLDMQIWYQSFGSLYSHCIKKNDDEFSGTVIDVGFGLTNACAFDSLTPIKGGCATISENILGKYVASEYTRMNPILLNDIFANAEGLALGARDIWQENQ